MFCFFFSDSICNGIALWTDYSFQDIEITTGPVDTLDISKYVKWYMNTQQGVYFIHPPVEVRKDRHILKYKISFNLETADTSFSFTVLEI